MAAPSRPRRRAIGHAHALRRGSTRDHVYSVLRERIVSLDLPPAVSVSEQEMADELGVSRTPVREAFIRLAQEGLVEIIPQLGSFIARIDVAEVLEAQFIRETLERGCLPGAVGALDPAASAKLASLLAEQEAAVESVDVPRFFSLDEEMHRYLIEMGGHFKVWPLVQSSKAHLDRVRRLAVPDPDIMRLAFDQHRQIIDGVMARDVETSDRHLREHLRLALGYLDPLAERYPEYFTSGQQLP